MMPISDLDRMAARITVFVGPARSGKTERLLTRYQEFLRGRAASGICGHGLWLAPNRRYVSELRETLGCGPNGALLNPGMNTFAGFAEKVIAASARRIRPISKLQKRLVLRRVVDKSLTSGTITERQAVARTPGFVARTPGFVEQLDEWIAACKRQDEWAEDLCQLPMSRRGRELAELYGQYQQLLLRGDLYDAEGRFWAAREILQQDKKGLCHEYGLVVVDGFSDFTTAQLDILRLLAERSAEVLFSLAAEPETLQPADPMAGRALLFAKPRNTFERLRFLFPACEVEFITPGQQGPGSLRQAERNLFRESPEISGLFDSLAGGPKELEIVAANGEQSEIEQIAGRLKELLLDGRARPQDCLVVFRNLAVSARRVADVFDDFGIPHWIEARPRLAGSVLVRTVVSLLRLKARDWPFRLLLEVTGSRTLSAFDEPLGNNPRACVERAIRAAQLPSGRLRLLEQVGKWAADESNERQELAHQSAIALANLHRLEECLEALPEHATLGQWTEHLAELLTRLGAFSDVDFSGDWLVLRRALHSLELIEGWLSEDLPAIGIEQFLELVELAARDQQLPGTHDEVGRVRVLSAETARGMSAAHVFLAGLSEQSLAASVQPGLAGSEDDPQLSSQTGDALADQSEPMLLFYSLVTRATEGLTLSYPALDDRGQQLPPSPFVTELQRCFPSAAIRVTTQPLGEVIATDKLPMSRSTHRQAAVARALDKDTSWLAGILARPESLGAGILDAVSCIASRAQRNQFGEYEGLLLGEATQAALARRFDSSHLWSPSQLESYAKCPFRFFAEQLLKLEPLEDLALTSDAGRRGSLLHQVLATIHQQLAEQTAELPENQSWQADLAERFRRALDAEVTARPLGGLEQSLREIERRQINSWATPYAQQENDYRNRWSDWDEPPQAAYFEVRFGPDVQSSAAPSELEVSTPVPFELDLGDEKIRITGQIDRIDVGRVAGVTVFNIIDYKSGREVRLKEDAVRSGRQLQLPLYALASEELLLADQQAQALSVGYWSIQGSGFEKGALELRQSEGQKLSPTEQWQQLHLQLVTTVRQLVTGVRDGQFPVFNEDQDCTRWCPQSTICRVAQIRSLEKQWPPATPEPPAEVAPQ